MAVDIKIPKNFGKSTIKAIRESLQDEEFLNRSGKVLQNNIRLEINQGISPETGSPFKPISKSWSDERDRLSEFNKTARGYQSGKSNLTFTGQFIKSIKFKIVSILGIKTIEVGAKGARKGYKYSKGGKRSKAPTNEQLGAYLKEQGRDPYGVSGRARKSIVNLAKRQIRKLLKGLREQSRTKGPNQ